METTAIRILLVEDNPGDARLIREMLAETTYGNFEIDVVTRLSQGLERLAQGNIDLVLLDLNLPDSTGLETFVRAYEYGSDLPFVVLTGLEDETGGLAALRRGAQDYLVKGKVDSELLSRSIRYALERRRTHNALLAERHKFTNLLEDLPAIVYVKDQNYSIHFANRQFEECLGAWEGKHCYEVIHGRLSPCGDCPIPEVFKTKKNHMRELSWSNNRIYQSYQYPLTDRDGTPLILSLGIDITEQKQAEEKEKYLATFPALNPTPVLEVNSSGKVIFYNPATLEVLGRLEAAPLPESFLPRDLPEILHKCHATKDEQFYREVKINGAVFGIEIYTVPQFNTLRLFARDITRRKQAEEALRQNQKDLERAQAVAQIGSWRMNTWRNELSWSRECSRIFGNSQDLPLTYENFLDCVHPEDREFVHRKWLSGLSGDPYDIECRIIADGTVKWIRAKTELESDPQGMLQGVFGIIQDVTRQKQAQAEIKEREDRLEAIYENAPLIMVLVDQDRRVRRINKLGERFSGKNASELTGRHGGEALGCLHSLDVPEGCGFGPHCQACQVRRTVLETFETGVSHQQVEACLPFAIDGEARKLTFLLCTALLQVEGQPQVLVTIQDITERKQMEEAQKNSERKMRLLTAKLLTAQEDERQRISRGLHDELGHALLTMKLDLGAMSKQLLPEQNGLTENVEELMGYVDEVVENVRRLYRGLTPGDLEDLGLTAALRNICGEFSRHQENILWSIHLDNIDELFTIEVQTNLYRIFQEILTNIGKHADPSEIMVSVKREDERVILKVRDNGRGFDAQSLRQQSQKSGMGLLAMEERIRILGGKVQVWSRKNEGTIISFEIPIEGSKMQAAIPEENISLARSANLKH